MKGFKKKKNSLGEMFKSNQVTLDRGIYLKDMIWLNLKEQMIRQE